MNVNLFLFHTLMIRFTKILTVKFELHFLFNKSFLYFNSVIQKNNLSEEFVKLECEIISSMI